jgi:hypothetical protein
MSPKSKLVKGIVNILLGKSLETLLVLSFHQSADHFGGLLPVFGPNVVGIIGWASAIPAKLGHIPPSEGVGTAKFVCFIRVAPNKWHKEDKFDIIIGFSIVN